MVAMPVIGVISGIIAAATWDGIKTVVRKMR